MEKDAEYSFAPQLCGANEDLVEWFVETKRKRKSFEITGEI